MDTIVKKNESQTHTFLAEQTLLASAQCKDTRLSLISLLLLADFVSFSLALFLSIALRLLFGDAWRFELYNQVLPVILVCLGIYALRGLYPAAGFAPGVELRRLVMTTSVVFLGFTGITFWLRDAENYSRLTISLTWLFALALVPLGRSFARALAARWELGKEPVAVIGNSEQSNLLIRYLRQNPKLGLEPAVVLDVQTRHISYMDGIPVVPAEQLLFDASYQSALEMDTAIVVSTGVPEDWMSRLTRYQGGNFRRLIIVPSLDRVSNLSLTSLNLGGVLGFELQHNLLNRKEQTLKRLLDLILVIVGGLLVSPFLLLIAALIKLDSKGSIIYGHTRVGLNGKKFKVWKFRTMFPNADQVLEDYLQAHPELRQEWDALHKLKDDPRVTRVGRYLRKYSLDEFPQLWNVLKGEMSLVGPRPIVEDEICRYDDCYEFYTQVKPGVTGMWQISGRNDTTYEERVRLDEFYVRNWSIWLDIVILARTLWVVLRPRGAY